MRNFVRAILLFGIVGVLLTIGFFSHQLFVEDAGEESVSIAGDMLVDVVEVRSLAQGGSGAPYLVQVQEGSKEQVYLAEGISKNDLRKKVYETNASLRIASAANDMVILEVYAGDGSDVVVVNVEKGTSYSVRDIWEEDGLLDVGSELGSSLAFEQWDQGSYNSFWIYSTHFVDKEPQYLVKISVADGAIEEKLPVYRGFPYQPYSE